MGFSQQESTSQKDVVKSLKATMAMAKIENLADNLNYRYGVEKAVSKYVGSEGGGQKLNLKEYESGQKIEYVGNIEAPLARSLIKGLGSNSKIDSLSIPGEVLNGDAKVILGDYVASNSKLKKIDLGGAISDEKSASVFGIALSNSNSVKYADISGSKFDDSSVKQFAEFLGDNDKLKLVATALDKNYTAKIQEISGKKVYSTDEAAEKKVSFSDNDNCGIKRSGSWSESMEGNGARKRSNAIASESEALKAR